MLDKRQKVCYFSLVRNVPTYLSYLTFLTLRTLLGLTFFTLVILGALARLIANTLDDRRNKHEQ